MKILNKVFLFLTISWNLSIYANFYSVFNTLWRVAFYTAGASRVAGPSVMSWMLQKRCESLPCVSSEVFDFCKERCERQNVKTDNLQIKVQKDYVGFAYVADSHTLIFSKQIHDDLQQALQDPTNEINLNAILICMFLIDHEIGHIKENDPLGYELFSFGSNLLTFAGVYYLMNHSFFKNWFAVPTNFRKFLVSLAAYNSLNLLFLANDTVNGLYGYSKEMAADKNAIKYASEPKSLRLAARYFEKVDESYINFLYEGKVNPNLPLPVRIQFENIRRILVAEYQSKDITEDFRNWVSKKTGYLMYLKFLADKTHPVGALRAKYLNAAADDLENKMAIS